MYESPALQGLNPEQTAGTHAMTWEKVVLKLRGGMMPPQGFPRPDEATLAALTTGIERLLDRQALASPDPGHTPVHRLNRMKRRRTLRLVE